MQPIELAYVNTSRRLKKHNGSINMVQVMLVINVLDKNLLIFINLFINKNVDCI